MLLFCNTDDNGTITASLKGTHVVPDRQYDHFFYLTVDLDVDDYQVQADTHGNAQLIPKEDT